MYMCMWGCLDKYIRVATWPLQTKFSGSALSSKISTLLFLIYSQFDIDQRGEREDKQFTVTDLENILKKNFRFEILFDSHR